MANGTLGLGEGAIVHIPGIVGAPCDGTAVGYVLTLVGIVVDGGAAPFESGPGALSNPRSTRAVGGAGLSQGIGRQCGIRVGSGTTGRHLRRRRWHLFNRGRATGEKSARDELFQLVFRSPGIVSGVRCGAFVVNRDRRIIRRQWPIHEEAKPDEAAEHLVGVGVHRSASPKFLSSVPSP